MVSLLPLLTRWTKLQFDRLMRTFLYFQRRTICFLRLQKIGVAVDAIFQILPGIYRVAARRQATHRKVSVLIRRFDPEAIGKLAIFLLRHGYHRGVGHRMVVVHLITVHTISVRIFSFSRRTTAPSI